MGVGIALSSDLSALLEVRGQIIQGFLTTLELAVIAVVGGTLIGMLVEAIRFFDIKVVNAALRIFVEVFRGTPLLMQLFFIYFGLPMLGYEVDKLLAAILAITLYSAAYVAEVLHSGAKSIPRGQIEAATALDLTRWQQLRHVVAPQTLKVVSPALAGTYVMVIKDTSLATVIGYTELTRVGQDLVLQLNQPTMTFTVIGALYFAICFPLSRLSARLERRTSHRGAFS